MPTLRSFFTIYTPGAAPRTEVAAPRGLAMTLQPMSEVVLPSADSELFGPHAAGLRRYRPRAAWLLALEAETSGSTGTFFADAHQVLRATTRGLAGWGFDVLRLWPFPLADLEALADDPFAEDLISVGFHEQGEHGFRAETLGLAKLGQREVSFAFRGRELLEDAALLCARLADYAMTQGRRVEHQSTMSFGFDKLLFLAAEGQAAGGPFRGWHPPIIQKLLPESLFPGVGVLEVQGFSSQSSPAQSDLTPALRRAWEQRITLDEHDLAGEAPHQSSTVKSCACAGGANGLKGQRHEPQSVKDSGWVFTCARGHPPAELGIGDLAALAQRLPQILKYLALPVGCEVSFAGEQGRVDASRAQHDDDTSF